jgi:metal-responsive CopG/Arc/MetJ family transcriptional regulator
MERLKLRTAQPGRGKFVSVSIPEELIKEIDKVLATRKLGYESRPEFIKESVRKRLEELKPLAR